MKFIQNVGYMVGIGVISAIGLAATGTSMPALAKETSGEKTMTAMEKKPEKADKVVYSYTAQYGDAYTQLVRKAVQTYGLKNDKEIGNARIIAIETDASEKAGWPELQQGEVVSFDESLIKTWVDDAMKLSESDVAAWQTYVPYVDFDTRNIGE